MAAPMLGQIKAAHNWVCDRRLGIQTAGEFKPLDTSAHHDASRSAPLHYGLINRYIRLLELQPSDIVYDLGCGSGRPLCLFARQNVAACVGVELDGGIADIARRNAVRLKGRRCEVAIIQADAASLDYADGTVFWIYNSFGSATMAAVLARIGASMERRPRAVRFCYVTPEAEEAFFAAGWLSRYRTVRPLLYPSGVASFWRSGGP
jgi:SAM-dependent methyltransferase